MTMPSYPIPKDLVAEYSAACQIVSQYEELRALGPVDPDKAAWAGQELETKTLIERITQLVYDLEFQTNARTQDQKDCHNNFVIWRKKYHDPLKRRIAILESAVSDEEWDTANPGTSDGETSWRINVNTLINNRTMLGRKVQEDSDVHQ
jgi:hypothetical protein